MKDKILTLLKRFFRAIWGSLSHNLGLKLLALLLAILLWSYVVSSNPSITRTKDINGLTAYLSNESTLNANRLRSPTTPRRRWTASPCGWKCRNPATRWRTRTTCR